MALRPSNLTTAGEARPKFAELNNLASEQLGAKILFATDDWFAVAENLLKDSDAEWREGEFTGCGKWMDGWETRRKRKPGHDWCIIQLGLGGQISGVDVDTSYFTGNYVPKVMIQAATLTQKEEQLIPQRRSVMGGEATEEELEQIERINSEKWQTIIPLSSARPGYRDTCHTYLPSTCTSTTFTHLRFNVYPDGGVARLRVFGSAVPLFNTAGADSQEIDLVALRNGGMCLGYSDAHYGHPRNLLNPWHPVNMADGWETARRLDRPSILIEGPDGVLQFEGHEWALFKLGVPGQVTRVEVYTYFFKGNYPDSCRVDGCLVRRGREVPDPTKDEHWINILPPQKLSPDNLHVFDGKCVNAAGTVSHIRLIMKPDGGISRINIIGKVSPAH